MEENEIDPNSKKVNKERVITHIIDIAQVTKSEEYLEHLICWLELESNLIIGHEPEICSFYCKKYPINKLVKVITNPNYIKTDGKFSSLMYRRILSIYIKILTYMYVDSDIWSPNRMSLVYQCNKSFEENTIDSYKRNKEDPVWELVKFLIEQEISEDKKSFYFYFDKDSFETLVKWILDEENNQIYKLH